MNSKLPQNMKEIITAFNEWYKNDHHSKKEDSYKYEINYEYLNGLKKDEFISFFEKFIRDGGGIQSLGQRNVDDVIKYLEEESDNFNNFRSQVLLPFEKDFDVDKWLEWSEDLKIGFGKGISTIYLNRVNKEKYCVVNKKSIEAYQKLGYEIKKTPLITCYNNLIKAEDDLIKRYPELENFYKADKLSHFLEEVIDKAMLPFSFRTLTDDELKKIAVSAAIKVKENEVLRNGWAKGLSEHIKKYSEQDIDLTNKDTLNDLFNSEAVCKTGQANSFPIENALNDEGFRKIFSDKVNKNIAKDNKSFEDYKNLYDELIEELKQRCGSKPLLKLNRALCALFPEHFSVIGNVKTFKHLHDAIFENKNTHPVEMHYNIFNKLNNLLGPIDKRNTQEFVERMILPWQIQEELFGDFGVTKQDEDKYPKIWKISHGKKQDFSDEVHDWLLENNYVAINYSPGHDQYKKFESIKANHYFYLVRKAQIILLGQLENEPPKEIEGMPGRHCRKFKPFTSLNLISEEARTPMRVIGYKKGDPIDSKTIICSNELRKKKFMPSGQSTVHEVDNANLEDFEKSILDPVFKLSLENLITSSFDEIPYDTAPSKGNKMHSLNQILYGPPGTGKTYNTVNKAIEIANPSFKIKVTVEDTTRKQIKEEFDRLMNEGQIVFTTFHQSMCYEDFIEGIKPETTPDDKRVIYEVKPGIFKNLCQAATTPNLIGFNAAYEQLIKELSEFDAADSDTTEVKTIEIKTPTGKPFSISLNSNNNLSLHTGPNKIKQGTLTRENIQAQINGDVKFIGWNGYFEGVCNYLKEKYNYSSTTENTAKNFVLIIDEINRGNVSQIFGELITLIEDDKRIGCPEALEVKLPYSKEKFGVPSNLYIIGTMNTADRSVEALDAALRRRFSFKEMPPDSDLIRKEGKLKGTEGKLSEISLPDLLDTINKRLEKLLDKDHQIGHSYFISVASLDDLKLAFQNKIIPLLQEYFFGDYGKIGLVLGKGFIEKKESTEIFANFSDTDADEFSERPIFKIKNPTSDVDFIEAINSLLNKKTNG